MDPDPVGSVYYQLGSDPNPFTVLKGTGSGSIYKIYGTTTQQKQHGNGYSKKFNYELEPPALVKGFHYTVNVAKNSR